MKTRAVSATALPPGIPNSQGGVKLVPGQKYTYADRQKIGTLRPGLSWGPEIGPDGGGKGGKNRILFAQQSVTQR